MAKKTKASSSAPPLRGWVLIGRDEDFNGERLKHGDWHLCWHEHFGTKKEALAFAKHNKWGPGFRAVRGELRVIP
jgi:hypothetical protein